MKKVSVKWKINQKKILYNEEQRVKWIENIEVRVRKNIISNRRLEVQEAMENNEHGKYVGKAKINFAVQNNIVNVWYSLKYV